MTVAGVMIEPMTLADLETTIGWAASEGWDPGGNDARCFWAADPGGFIAARLDDEMVGAISAVRYADRFGFIGLFIVLPEFRGRGIGMQLWAAAMHRLDGRIIGLDGVVAMQGRYASSGFVLDHRNLRFRGALPMASAIGRAGIAASVRALGPDDAAAVLAYDEPLFGASRPEFMGEWLAQEGAVTVGLEGDDGLCGFGTIRPTCDGFKIGPLFADDPTIARSLITALAEHADSRAVALDVPESNPAALDLARGLGMTVSFETARMYAGGDPGLATDRVFGVTTFELG